MASSMWPSVKRFCACNSSSQILDELKMRRELSKIVRSILTYFVSSISVVFRDNECVKKNVSVSIVICLWKRNEKEILSLGFYIPLCTINNQYFFRKKVLLVLREILLNSQTKCLFYLDLDRNERMPNVWSLLSALFISFSFHRSKFESGKQFTTVIDHLKEKWCFFSVRKSSMFFLMFVLFVTLFQNRSWHWVFRFFNVPNCWFYFSIINDLPSRCCSILHLSNTIEAAINIGCTDDNENISIVLSNSFRHLIQDVKKFSRMI